MTHKDYEKCWNAYIKERQSQKPARKPAPATMPDLDLGLKIALRMWCWGNRMKNKFGTN